MFQELRHTDVARLGELMDQLAAAQSDGTAAGNGPDVKASGAADHAAQDAQPTAASATCAAAASLVEPERDQDSGQAAFDSVRTRSRGSNHSTSTHASNKSGASKEESG